MIKCICSTCVATRVALSKASPGKELMEENEILARVHAIAYATKYLENNENLVAVKIFDVSDASKLGIRIDKKEKIFSKKTFLVLSKFKYRNTNFGNWWQDKDKIRLSELPEKVDLFH